MYENLKTQSQFYIKNETDKVYGDKNAFVESENIVKIAKFVHSLCNLSRKI